MMQSPETITQSQSMDQTNADTIAWQWQASHLMPTDNGLMAFVPAGPVSFEREQAHIKVLQSKEDPQIVGLACDNIVIPLEASTLDHLIEVAEQDNGNAFISIVSLPRETNIAIPIVGFEVVTEDLEKLRQLVMTNT